MLVFILATVNRKLELVHEAEKWSRVRKEGWEELHTGQ